MAKYCPLPTKLSRLRHNTRFGYESRIVIYYRTILREIQIFNLQTWNNKKINPPSCRKTYNRSIRGAVLAANEESLLTENRRKSNLFFWSLNLTEGRRKVRWSPFVDGGTQKRSLNLQIPVRSPWDHVARDSQKLRHSRDNLEFRRELENTAMMSFADGGFAASGVVLIWRIS